MEYCNYNSKIFYCAELKANYNFWDCIQVQVMTTHALEQSKYAQPFFFDPVMN